MVDPSVMNDAVYHLICTADWPRLFPTYVCCSDASMEPFNSAPSSPDIALRSPFSSLVSDNFSSFFPPQLPRSTPFVFLLLPNSIPLPALSSLVYYFVLF
ncbi:uncharacterized protein AKAW2_30624A [Aspergillus luchuensis]|uniref:Uncharacterized protein n=1 Tax=Aspergillus kawachii TaxID=1069201 RepID=A0A7R7W6J7_ASPKA|nr:uncharacterized protein AKAW2_30624A [Aspergillus luchuensis]BCR97305.1 hypothetical protein AKAW2_30624A [Aspergillus luchuensis]